MDHQKAQNSHKILVLDLDECLIHSKFSLEDTGGVYDFSVPFLNKSGKECTAYVRKRPHLDRFFEEISKLGFLEICVFTAGIESYAESILTQIDPNGIISRRFYRKDCFFCPNQLCFKKDLKLVTSDLSQVVLVDNSPMCFFTQQLKNGVPVSNFIHDKKDRELVDLVVPVLRNIIDSPTVYEPVNLYKQVFLQMLVQKRDLQPKLSPVRQSHQGQSSQHKSRIHV